MPSHGIGEMLVELITFLGIKINIFLNIAVHVGLKVVPVL
jgi:hypothetical protein